MNKQCFDMLRKAVEEHEYLIADPHYFKHNKEYIEGYLHAREDMANYIDTIIGEYEYEWAKIEYEIDHVIKGIQYDYLSLTERYGVSFIHGYHEFLVRVKNRDIPRIQGLFTDQNK